MIQIPFFLLILSATEIILDTNQKTNWDIFVNSAWGQANNVNSQSCRKDNDEVVHCMFMPADRTLFVVGDSVSQGSSLGFGWPSLVVSDGLKVFNTAISGYVGSGCLGLYKYNVKPFNPDNVAILCGINDLKNNSFS